MALAELFHLANVVGTVNSPYYCNPSSTYLERGPIHSGGGNLNFLVAGLVPEAVSTVCKDAFGLGSLLPNLFFLFTTVVLYTSIFLVVTESLYHIID